MHTGFPGHNKGKRFAPGVGYVPRHKPAPEKPRPPAVCERCGNPARFFYYPPPDPTSRECGKLCEACMNDDTSNVAPHGRAAPARTVQGLVRQSYPDTAVWRKPIVLLIVAIIVVRL